MHRITEAKLVKNTIERLATKVEKAEGPVIESEELVKYHEDSLFEPSN